jgi:hypothetical protein
VTIAGRIVARSGYALARADQALQASLKQEKHRPKRALQSARAVARLMHYPAVGFIHRETVMKTINSGSYLALLGVAAFSIFSAGCDAVEEVGEGVEEVGDDLEDAAD